jgi:long-chain acyl-CoA synthetase
MLTDNILQNATRKPDAAAVSDMSRSLTYKELNMEIDSKAGFIGSLGLRPNEPVGLMFPNSVNAVTWMLAIAKEKHPVVLFGSKMKKSEVMYHLDKINLKITIGDARIISSWPNTDGVAATYHDSGNTAVLYYERAAEEVNAMFQEDDFICHFTSGSEGEPKAAIRTFQAVEYEIVETYSTLGMKEDQTFLTIPPISHSFGLIAGTLMPLYYGHKLILVDEFLPAEVLNTISLHNVNVIFAVPYMYYLLNRCLQLNKADFSSVNMCFSAGAPLSSEVSGTFRRLTGVSIIQDYGSTETGVICLNLESDRFPAAVGKPVINRTIKVIGENGEEIKRGGSETGEICVLSKATARAYLYPAELNSLKFRDGYFRTGDIGRVGDEGEVYIHGRLNFIINVAGNKVDPVELENVIKQIPQVREVAVVGINDPNIGSVIKAVIVSDGVLDAVSVKKFCKSRLADYKIPRIVEFVDELPRSQTGKILRKYLVKEFSE